MIAFFIQLLVPAALLCYRFQRREYFWIRLILFGGLFLGLSALYASPDILFFLPGAIRYFLYYFMAYFFLFLYMFACLDLPFLHLLFYMMVTCIIQNFSHHIFELVMRIGNVPLNEEYDTIEGLLFLGLVYFVVYTIFFFVFLRQIKPSDFTKLAKGNIIFLSVAFFLVMIILGVYIRHIRQDLFLDFGVWIVYELYSVILDIFLLLMEFNVFQVGQLDRENIELQTRIQCEERYYDSLRKSMDIVNIKCHDLKHQVAALSTMKDQIEREHSIEELQEAVLIYDSIAKTGNSALDCVLTDKGLLCMNHSINFTVIADGETVSFMEYSDIYILFANAIDNAIESVSKVKEKSHRIISLKITEKMGMVNIHLENYCDHDVEYNGELPRTTKQEKGHGYGLKSIKYIASKYGGTISTQGVKNMFFLDIFLPADYKKEKRSHLYATIQGNEE